MSLIFATQLTAVATAALAVFAIVTALFALLAFRKQSEEVRAIEQQVTDQQELTRQQAELLKVQSGQLELQRHQLDDQREANARQAEVLELQAAELRESLKERSAEVNRRRKAQAAQVFFTEEHVPARDLGGTQPTPPTVHANVVNSSNQPVYDAELRWHRGSASHGDPNPQPLGTIMPGSSDARTQKFPADTNLDASGAVLRFRDASGVTWTRRPDGGLTEQQP